MLVTLSFGVSRKVFWRAYSEPPVELMVDDLEKT